MTWRPLCDVEATREGRAVRVEVDGLALAVVRSRGCFHVFSDRCPHAGGSLGTGWVEEEELVCPLHRWRFRLDSGRCADAVGSPVARYACEIRAGRIWAFL